MKLYKEIDLLIDAPLWLIDSDYIEEKYCISDDTVLMKNKKEYDRWLRLVEDNEVEVECNYWKYMYRNFGDDENFKFIGNQYDISADDYYTEGEINELIVNYPFLYLYNYDEVVDTSDLLNFEKYLVYEQFSDKGRRVFRLEEYSDTLKCVGSFDKYFDVELNNWVKTLPYYYYSLYKDNSNNFYEVVNYHYNYEIPVARLITKEEIVKKFDLQL